MVLEITSTVLLHKCFIYDEGLDFQQFCNRFVVNVEDAKKIKTELNEVNSLVETSCISVAQGILRLRSGTTPLWVRSQLVKSSQLRCCYGMHTILATKISEPKYPNQSGITSFVLRRSRKDLTGCLEQGLFLSLTLPGPNLLRYATAAEDGRLQVKNILSSNFLFPFVLILASI